MGLDLCPMMVSCLGVPMPLFWLMELDLISLCTTVSSDRFWDVYALHMMLGSPLSFGSVRHVYFCSHVQVALSAHVYCCQPPTCPCNLHQGFHTSVLTCGTGWSFLGEGMYDAFFSSLILPFASLRLVWSSFHTLACPLHCGGLCVLLLAPQACL